MTRIEALKYEYAVLNDYRPLAEVKDSTGGILPGDRWTLAAIDKQLADWKKEIQAAEPSFCKDDEADADAIGNAMPDDLFIAVMQELQIEEMESWTN